MGAVADILTSKEWAAKPAYEKAAARKDLFEDTLKQNPEFNTQFQGADQPTQQKLYDQWKDDVEKKFPDAFVTEGNAWTQDEKSKGLVFRRPVDMPVLDLKTESLLKATDPNTKEGNAARKEMEAHLQDNPEALRQFKLIYAARYGYTGGSKVPDELIQTTKEMPFLDKAKLLAPTAVRAVGAVAGGAVAGTLATPETLGAGTVPAAALGSAGGAAVVEPFAQYLERKLGERKEYSLGQGALNVLVAGIPLSKVPGGTPLLMRAGARMAEGAMVGGAYNAIDQALFSDKPFSLSELNAAIATGGAAGAGVEAVASLAPALKARLIGKKPAEIQAELPAMISKATAEDKPALTALQEKIDSLLSQQGNKPAAESAGVFKEALDQPAPKAAETTLAKQETAKVDPIVKSMSDISGLSSEDYFKWAHSQEGGQTAESNRVGIAAIGNEERIAALKSGRDAADKEYKTLIDSMPSLSEKELNAVYNKLSTVGAKRQFFSEAIGAAENTGSASTLPEVQAAHGVDVTFAEKVQDSISKPTHQSAAESAEVFSQALDAPAPAAAETALAQQIRPARQTLGNWSAGAQTGAVNTALLRNAGMPAVGGIAGSAYGLYDGKTPEERAAKAWQYGLLGLGAGSIAGRMIFREPNAMVKDAKLLSQGEANLPKSVLALRDTEAMTRLRETIGNNPLARPQRAITKQFQASGETVPEAQNFWLRASNFPGIVKAKVAAAAEDVAQHLKYTADTTLNDLAKASGKPYEEYAALLNDYVTAVHAPAVNKAHPEYSTVNPGLHPAGMSDSEAATVVADVKARGLDKYFEPIRQQLRDFNQAALDERVASGLLTRKEADGLKKLYPDYVPLNRVMDEEDTNSVISSLFGPKKFSVLASGVKKLEGSQREVDDVLTSSFVNMRDAVVRGEQNRVAQQLRSFYKANPSPEVAIRPFKVGENAPNQVNVRYAGPDGQTHVDAVTFKDPLFAKAMNGVGRYQADAIDRTLGKATGLLTSLYTRFDPTFQAKNKVRDLQDAFKYALATGDAPGAVKTAAKGITAIGAVSDGLRGLDTPGAQLYKRAEVAGAFTGGIAPVSRKEADKLIASYSPNQPLVKQAVQASFKGVDFINDVLNQSTYLPIFERLVQNGATDAEAALAARKSSIDFDLKSDAVKKLSVLYGFVGPSIHGAKNSAKWLARNPRTIGEALVAFTGAAMAVDQLNSQYDPNWKRRKQMDGYRASGIPIAFAGDSEGYYVANIPVSQSIRLVKGAADAAADAGSGETFDSDYTSERLGKIAYDSLNFMGGRSPRQAVTPTLADPAMDISANENYAGTPIMPQANRQGQETSRVFPRTADSKTGEGAIAASRWLRDRMGWDVSPEALLYGVKGYGGGPAKIGLDAVDVSAGKSGGRKESPNRWPLLSGFVKYVKYDSPMVGTSDKQLEHEVSSASDRNVDTKSAGYKAFQDFQQLKSDEDKKAFVTHLYTTDKDAFKAFEAEFDRAGKRVNSSNADNIRMLNSLGSDSGDRAKSLSRILGQMEPEQAKQFLMELHQAGGFGPEVQKQLSFIQSQNQ